jgi:putative membrane protein
MTNLPADPSARAAGEPSQADIMAHMRTIMAADRTLMAWTRTALSLMSFSFTIYKVLQGLQEEGKPLHPNAPVKAGLFLAAMGVLAMAMGSAQYAGAMRDLARMQKIRRFFRMPAIMAGLLLIIGVILFIGIAIRRI